MHHTFKYGDVLEHENLNKLTENYEALENKIQELEDELTIYRKESNDTRKKGKEDIRNSAVSRTQSWRAPEKIRIKKQGRSNKITCIETRKGYTSSGLSGVKSIIHQSVTRSRGR